MTNETELERVLDEFGAELTRAKLEPKTIKSYQGRMRQLGRYYPRRPLDALTLNDISEFFRARKAHWSASTLNIGKAACIQFYNRFRKQRLDFDAIPRTPAKARKLTAMPHEIYLKLCSLDLSPSLRLMLTLMYEHGISAGEVSTIRFGDLNSSKRTLTYKRAHPGTRRVISLSDPQYALIQEMHAQTKNPNVHLLRSPRGRPLDANWFNPTYSRKMHELGYPRGQFPPQSMRTAYVVNRYLRGHQLSEILADVGTDSGETLKAYLEMLESLPKKSPSSTGMHLRSRIEVCPVFAGRQFVPRNETGFVLMPFCEKWSNRVWGKIKEIVINAGFVCKRADDLFGQDILEDIWVAVNEATIIIADVTKRNPNVMYEVGIAHTVGKDVILLTQDVTDIPSDFQRFRHIVYEDNADGFNKLASELPNYLRARSEGAKPI
jgi:integrase